MVKPITIFHFYLIIIGGFESSYFLFFFFLPLGEISNFDGFKYSLNGVKEEPRGQLSQVLGRSFCVLDMGKDFFTKSLKVQM